MLSIQSILSIPRPRRSLPAQEKREASSRQAGKRQEYPVVAGENLVKQTDNQQHAGKYPKTRY